MVLSEHSKALHAARQAYKYYSKQLQTAAEGQIAYYEAALQEATERFTALRALSLKKPNKKTLSDMPIEELLDLIC